MASVSIIIVSYHTGPALWLAIASALKQAERKELIIVNNGNMLGDEKRLEQLALKEPRIKILSGHGNIGFGKGCNLGVKNASGDYVLLLNPDSMLPQNGLATLIAEIQKYPDNTLAGCYLINPDGREQRGGRRALLTPQNAIAESLGLNRFLKSPDKLNYNKLPMPKETHEVPVISGAFMFLSRSFYNQLGGFDEGYFLHMEDTDFCYRVHQAHGKVICIPDVKVIHFRSTSDASGFFVERHKAKGFIRYLNKYFANQHSKKFMKALEMGIWLRLLLKTGLNIINRLFVPPLAAKYEIARLALLYQLTRFAPQNTSLAGKTIVITGSTSQMGLAIVGMALARGAKVIAFYNRTTIAFSHPNLEWVRGDLTQDENRNILASTKADILIHAAPLSLLPAIIHTLPNDTFKRIITFGSDLIADEKSTKDTREIELITNLKTTEDEVLLTGELHARNVTILRTFMPYGVGLDNTVTPLADRIRRFGFVNIYGDAQGLRNPVHVHDVANAVFAALDNPNTFGKTYDIGGDEISYRGMIYLLSEYIGKPVKLTKSDLLPGILDGVGKLYHMHHVNRETLKRMSRNMTADNTPAIQDFGFRTRDFLEGDVTV